MPKEPVSTQGATENRPTRDTRDRPAPVPDGEPMQRIRERGGRMLDERGEAYSNHEEILIQASREIDNEDGESG